MTFKWWYRGAAKRFYRRPDSLKRSVAAIVAVQAVKIERWLKARSIRRQPGERAAWVALVLAVIVGVGVLMTATGLLNFGATAPTCSASAVRQLPASLVQRVNAIEARRDIATADSPEFITTLASRSIPGGTAQAFTNFDPRYCGFDGNINDFSSGKNASAFGNSIPGDYVVLIRHGHPSRYAPDGVCISDTVPTVRMSHGILVMTFRCDRLYPNSTWLQNNPKLKAIR